MGLIRLIVGGIVDTHKYIKQTQAQNDDTYQNVVVDGKFSINIPSFLSPMNKINEDAAIQYGSKTLDVAFLVIDEPKDVFIKKCKELDSLIPSESTGNITTLDRFASIILDSMFNLDDVEVTDYHEKNINGLNAITINVFQKRTFFKDAVYSSFAFIEGRNRLYQIMIMTGGTSITKIAEKMEAAIFSFKELD